MINKILDILKNNENLFAWNLKAVTKNSYQLFFIKQNLDMNRELKIEEFFVSIFIKKEVNGKEMIGSNNFQIHSSLTEQEIKDKIDEQIKLCDFTMNKPYTFPKKTNLKPIAKETGFSGHSLKEAAFIVADALFEADKFDKGYLNSSEIYISHNETKFFDSNGNNFLYTSEKGEIELVATWQEKKEEAEAYRFFEIDSINSILIYNEAQATLLEASHRLKAIKTPKLNNIKVLLTNDYVKRYFNFFVMKAKTDAIYAHLSNFFTGKDLFKKNTEADKFSIRLEPTLKNSTLGMPFDDEGIVLKRLNIYEKGVVKNLWGSNAKSQYLNKPVNGSYINMVVNGGTLQKKDLDDETYVEIVSLSDFDIDLLTGDFKSEIRLAFLYNKNKEKVAITGGSISGNVFESLGTARFSNDTKQNNNFIGPKFVLLDNVVVSSGE